MENLITKIKKEWMQKVRFAQIEIGEKAPLEVMNTKPTLIHRDSAMRYFHMILEEGNEYKDAVKDTDLTDEERIILIADALGDIDYIKTQMIVSHGLEYTLDKDRVIEVKDITIGESDKCLGFHKRLVFKFNQYKDVIQNPVHDKYYRIFLIKNILIDVEYILNEMIVYHGLSNVIREVLNEIHKSNLTKIEGEDIKMNSIGKIQKPLSYKKPNIKKVLGI